MAKKRRTKARSSTGLVRLTKQKIVDGLPGPDGVRIRYAVPEEADAVTELLKMADDDLETGHLEALADGQCGTWLLDALTGARPAVRSQSTWSQSQVIWSDSPVVSGDLVGVTAVR
ncbi:hypothetical protein OOK58_00930 [Streptomyces sp. NBC_01728]|nr:MULTISPECIES: hypothetical protein [unclassified Streptomyces]MCX4461279.1 hypothetical protein [Streptomyces sp. NBC_01719]MCX4490187.1 hypothetical protein [Streptomyces sp. NBC_01728]MCX4597002.1 hypothetical protein [Streptomyces sp. NBC_01549]